LTSIIGGEEGKAKRGREWFESGEAGGRGERKGEAGGGGEEGRRG
jgi:hypothetical protein